MITPFDWQEGIGNRAQYIEGKLRHGSPVLAVSLESGILIYTRRRQSRKIFEVYDRLGFAAIGQQSDVESLRTAAVEFAHQEGYNRSEQDVTIQRVVTALSGPVKKAFADFSSAPLVAKSVFAEVNASPEEDEFYVLGYDGDYSRTKQYAIVSGVDDFIAEATPKIEAISPESDPASALTVLAGIWEHLTDRESGNEDLEPEAMLIDRSGEREDRFRMLLPEG